MVQSRFNNRSNLKLPEQKSVKRWQKKVSYPGLEFFPKRSEAIIETCKRKTRRLD